MMRIQGRWDGEGGMDLGNLEEAELPNRVQTGNGSLLGQWAEVEPVPGMD